MKFKFKWPFEMKKLPNFNFKRMLVRKPKENKFIKNSKMQEKLKNLEWTTPLTDNFVTHEFELKDGVKSTLKVTRDMVNLAVNPTQELLRYRQKQFEPFDERTLQQALSDVEAPFVFNVCTTEGEINNHILAKALKKILKNTLIEKIDENGIKTNDGLTTACTYFEPTKNDEPLGSCKSEFTGHLKVKKSTKPVCDENGSCDCEDE